MLSCSGSGGRQYLNYEVSESGTYFNIRAKYDKQYTDNVDGFMDRYFNRYNNISFTNTEMDANLTLDDGTSFYIKKQPGYIAIKFNKEKNTPAAFGQMKLFAERLKTVMKQ
jgi:hypothetical protein